MGEITLLRDLAVVMVAAAATTVLCHRLRQPVVIGYLLAGLLIGPHTPPFSLVSDIHSIQTMAQLGLVFLMFSLGLEFNLPKLQRVGLSAALAAALEVICVAAIGFGLGRWFGWSQVDSIFLGAILCISSTTIIAKVFSELHLTREPFTQVVYGILILQDVVAVVILTVLSGLKGANVLEGELALKTMAQVTFFVILFLVFGLALIPRMVRWVARLRSKETLGVVVLGLCLASALLANRAGFSMALGAFLMGSIIGVSHEIEAIEDWIHPIRDMFCAIFFVSAGLRIDPQLLMAYKGPILILSAAVIAGQTVTGSLGTFLAGYDAKTAVRVGMSLTQIGEFSFVIASLALSNRRASDFLYPLAVAVSGLTTLTTPYLIRNSDRVVDRAFNLLPSRLTKSLERYPEWLKEKLAGPGEGGTVLSKYMVRLIVYAVLLSASGTVVGFIAHSFSEVRLYRLIVWVTGVMACLPLIRAVTNYLSHFLLLTITEAIVRFRLSALLARLPIHQFYTGIELLLTTGLTFLFAWKTAPRLGDFNLWLVGLAVITGSMVLLRPWTHLAQQWLEQRMDEILGLATSEPLRQATLKSKEKGGAFADAMERLYLNRKDPAVHQTIRALGLREKTGASVVAIYRRGKLTTNPSAEMVLLANDILVLIGNPEERRMARQFLTR